jgi:hypothetical protein
MMQNGRGVDPGFKPSHQLYHRCVEEDIDEGRFLAARMSCTNTSVNWSKYSKPWDVIFDRPECGIVRFIVGDLPREIPKEQTKGGNAKLCSFEPSHAPCQDNYSHSEIGMIREGKRVPSPKPGALVKKEFRAIMSDKGLLLLPPHSAARSSGAWQRICNRFLRSISVIYR